MNIAHDTEMLALPKANKQTTKKETNKNGGSCVTAGGAGDF